MTGRKNVLDKAQIITNGNMSTASITSSIVKIKYIDNICIQLNFTGTPTGTFAVQGSLDHVEDPLTGEVIVAGNWIALTLKPSPVASGSADQILIDMNQLSFPYIRVVYTKTSGTGTLNAFIGAKMV